MLTSHVYSIQIFQRKKRHAELTIKRYNWLICTKGDIYEDVL